MGSVRLVKSSVQFRAMLLVLFCTCAGATPTTLSALHTGKNGGNVEAVYGMLERLIPTSSAHFDLGISHPADSPPSTADPDVPRTKYSVAISGGGVGTKIRIEGKCGVQSGQGMRMPWIRWVVALRAPPPPPPSPFTSTHTLPSQVPQLQR